MKTKAELKRMCYEEIYPLYAELEKYEASEKGVMQHFLDDRKNQIKYRKGEGLYIWDDTEWVLLKWLDMHYANINIMNLFLEANRYICTVQTYPYRIRQAQIRELRENLRTQPKTKENREKMNELDKEYLELNIPQEPVDNYRNLYFINACRLHRMLVNHCIKNGWLYTD